MKIYVLSSPFLMMRDEVDEVFEEVLCDELKLWWMKSKDVRLVSGWRKKWKRNGGGKKVK